MIKRSRKMRWVYCSALFALSALPSTPLLADEEKTITPDTQTNQSSGATPAIQLPSLGSGLPAPKASGLYNITRLIARTTSERAAYAQASVIRFPSDIFLVELFDHIEPWRSDPSVNYFELNLGGRGFGDREGGGLVGWVCRTQAGTGISNTINSCGAQYNWSSHSGLTELRKGRRLTAFVQIFPIKNDDTLGKVDVVAYYSFTIYKPLYIRGYVNWYHYPDQKDYLRVFEDFIYPVNRLFDIFVRHTYQNRNDIQYGVTGSQYEIGFRYNFSL